jgi:hypothetical protein
VHDGVVTPEQVEAWVRVAAAAELDVDPDALRDDPV